MEKNKTHQTIDALMRPKESKINVPEKTEKFIRKSFLMPDGYMTKMSKYMADNLVEYQEKNGKRMTETTVILLALDKLFSDHF